MILSSSLNFYLNCLSNSFCLLGAYFYFYNKSCACNYICSWNYSSNNTLNDVMSSFVLISLLKMAFRSAILRLASLAHSLYESALSFWHWLRADCTSLNSARLYKSAVSLLRLSSHSFLSTFCYCKS